MQQALISVCIVTYNHQAYIADCLMSVLAQYGDFRLEILVGDDASSDNTANIVRDIASKYPQSIRLFSHSHNLGPSKNCCFLIEQAQGDFIAHLDGDDFWLPDKLRTQYQFLMENAHCSACYTNAAAITHQKEPVGYFNPRLPLFITLEHLLKSGNFLNNSSMLYRAVHRTLLLQYPDELLDYRIHLTFATQGEIGFINQVLTVYRTNSIASQMTTMRSQVLLLYIDAIIAMKPYLPSMVFQQVLLNFCRTFLINITVNYQKDIAQQAWQKIKQHYSLNTFNILVRILPACILMEAKSFFYKKTFGRELRFLQRNGVN